MTIPAYVSLVTLGVADVANATAFYKRLGLRRDERFSNDDVSFFQLANMVLSVWDRASLAQDAGLADTPKGFSGIALAINVVNEQAVDAALHIAETAGATITKPARVTFWGGYAGYFADPDGHVWEVAYNPFASLDANGRLNLENAG